MTDDELEDALHTISENKFYIDFLKLREFYKKKSSIEIQSFVENDMNDIHSKRKYLAFDKFLIQKIKEYFSDREYKEILKNFQIYLKNNPNVSVEYFLGNISSPFTSVPSSISFNHNLKIKIKTFYDNIQGNLKFRTFNSLQDKGVYPVYASLYIIKKDRTIVYLGSLKVMNRNELFSKVKNIADNIKIYKKGYPTKDIDKIEIVFEHKKDTHYKNLFLRERVRDIKFNENLNSNSIVKESRDDDDDSLEKKDDLTSYLSQKKFDYYSGFYVYPEIYTKQGYTPHIQKLLFWLIVKYFNKNKMPVYGILKSLYKKNNYNAINTLNYFIDYINKARFLGEKTINFYIDGYPFTLDIESIDDKKYKEIHAFKNYLSEVEKEQNPLSLDNNNNYPLYMLVSLQDYSRNFEFHVKVNNKNKLKEYIDEVYFYTRLNDDEYKIDAKISFIHKLSDTSNRAAKPYSEINKQYKWVKSFIDFIPKDDINHLKFFRSCEDILEFILDIKKPINESVSNPVIKVDFDDDYMDYVLDKNIENSNLHSIGHTLKDNKIYLNKINTITKNLVNKKYPLFYKNFTKHLKEQENEKLENIFQLQYMFHYINFYLNPGLNSFDVNKEKYYIKAKDYLNKIFIFLKNKFFLTARNDAIYPFYARFALFDIRGNAYDSFILIKNKQYYKKLYDILHDLSFLEKIKAKWSIERITVLKITSSKKSSFNSHFSDVFKKFIEDELYGNNQSINESQKFADNLEGRYLKPIRVEIADKINANYTIKDYKKFLSLCSKIEAKFFEKDRFPNDPNAGAIVQSIKNLFNRFKNVLKDVNGNIVSDKNYNQENTLNQIHQILSVFDGLQHYGEYPIFKKLYDIIWKSFKETDKTNLESSWSYPVVLRAIVNYGAHQTIYYHKLIENYDQYINAVKNLKNKQNIEQLQKTFSDNSEFLKEIESIYINFDVMVKGNLDYVNQDKRFIKNAKASIKSASKESYAEYVKEINLLKKALSDIIDKGSIDTEDIKNILSEAIIPFVWSEKGERGSKVTAVYNNKTNQFFFNHNSIFPISYGYKTKINFIKYSNIIKHEVDEKYPWAKKLISNALFMKNRQSLVSHAKNYDYDRSWKDIFDYVTIEHSQILNLIDATKRDVDSSIYYVKNFHENNTKYTDPADEANLKKYLNVFGFKTKENALSQFISFQNWLISLEKTIINDSFNEDINNKENYPLYLNVVSLNDYKVVLKVKVNNPEELKTKIKNIETGKTRVEIPKSDVFADIDYDEQIGNPGYYYSFVVTSRSSLDAKDFYWQTNEFYDVEKHIKSGELAYYAISESKEELVSEDSNQEKLQELIKNISYYTGNFLDLILTNPNKPAKNNMGIKYFKKYFKEYIKKQFPYIEEMDSAVLQIRADNKWLDEEYNQPGLSEKVLKLLKDFRNIFDRHYSHTIFNDSNYPLYASVTSSCREAYGNQYGTIWYVEKIKNIEHMLTFLNKTLKMFEKQNNDECEYLNKIYFYSYNAKPTYGRFKNIKTKYGMLYVSIDNSPFPENFKETINDIAQLTPEQYKNIDNKNLTESVLSESVVTFNNKILQSRHNLFGAYDSKKNRMYIYDDEIRPDFFYKQPTTNTITNKLFIKEVKKNYPWVAKFLGKLKADGYNYPIENYSNIDIVALTRVIESSVNYIENVTFYGSEIHKINKEIKIFGFETIQQYINACNEFLKWVKVFNIETLNYKKSFNDVKNSSSYPLYLCVYSINDNKTVKEIKVNNKEERKSVINNIINGKIKIPSSERDVNGYSGYILAYDLFYLVTSRYSLNKNPKTLESFLDQFYGNDHSDDIPISISIGDFTQKITPSLQREKLMPI